jgi:hypothetical protein
MSWWFRAFALGYLLIGCFMLARVLGTDLDAEKPFQYLGLVLMALFPLVGAGLSLHAFTARIRFDATMVERETLWGRKSMPFSSIRGRREFIEQDTESGSTRYIRLESNDGSPALVFGKKLYGFDDAFWSWYRQLPNLDAEDHKHSNFGLV